MRSHTTELPNDPAQARQVFLAELSRRTTILVVTRGDGGLIDDADALANNPILERRVVSALPPVDVGAILSGLADPNGLRAKIASAWMVSIKAQDPTTGKAREIRDVADSTEPRPDRARIMQAFFAAEAR